MPWPLTHPKRDKTQLRQHQATAAVGFTGVAAGGAVRDRGVRRINATLPERTHRHPEPLRLARTLRKPGLGQARVLWLGGTALGTVGAAGATKGTLNLVHDHQVKKDFLGDGVRGTLQATKDTYKRKPPETHPNRRRAVVVGAVAGGGAVAGQLSRRGVKLSALARHPGLHPAIHATAGTLGGVASLPVGNRLASHVSHRTGKKPVRPSSQASTVEARPGKGADPAEVRRQLASGRVAKSNPDGADLHVPGVMVATGKRRKPKLTDPQSWSVAKADVQLTPRQQREALHRRQRQFALNAGGVAAGTTAFGLSVGSHKRMPKAVSLKAKRLAPHVGLVAAGLGTASALNSIHMQHHELQAQKQAVLKGVRAPAYRKSFLQTRRSGAGILKTVRVSAGLVR